ncbi:MAG: phosphoribosylformylglycinamidine synthase subunit PurL [Myxococcales bacterium]|nr:phosphoribosylformylglycinamidine synthase subunit PurL [Myxococcales bacterium]
MNPGNEQDTITDEMVQKHGLSPEEYQRLLGVLGREPTFVELGVFSVMWSEHCSYKSSRIHLGRLPTTGPRVLIGPGENAGVVDLGDGLAACFKMESHNHPSYIEPYQGAATGVGGILRDVFTMGARPVALMDSLRFGRLDHPKTRGLVRGVVAGIAGYGNCMGVPTVAGETRFDRSYDGNCLVNAFCCGIVASDRIFLGTTGAPGNKVFYVGAGTGRDGIHGATMASTEFGEGSEEKRPTVQVGDPFQEKLLLEACLELMQGTAIVGIQDMGAAGLTSSSVEMAGRGGRGLLLRLDLVPMRETGMVPYELLLSESQERMLIVIEPGREQEVFDVFRKWDLSVAEIGEVTDDGVWRCTWHGEEVAAIPVAVLTDSAPKYDRPQQAPAALPGLPEIVDPDPVGRLPAMLADPDISDKQWIWRQYDHQVGTDTVVGPGADAALVRIKGTRKYLAYVCDSNGRHVVLDPFVGTAGQVAECARNLACVGATPVGLSDCMNFGNPRKPEIMWQFARSVDGMAEACRALGVPVISGNVSLYNETDGVGILPTPGLAMVGLYEGPPPRVAGRFPRGGLTVALLGGVGRSLGGSVYARQFGFDRHGSPPLVDYAAEVALHDALRALIGAGAVEVAHDLSDGGLLVALAECCMEGVGGIFNVGGDAGALYGEDHGRALIAFAPEHAVQVRALTEGVSFRELGHTGGDVLRLADTHGYAVAELQAVWRNSFPEWLNAGAVATLATA